LIEFVFWVLWSITSGVHFVCSFKWFIWIWISWWIVVLLEIQVDNRFIVVCCDFTSSTLVCRWRSNPRSSLRFKNSLVDPPTSVLAHSSRPRERSQSPRSSMLHIVFRTPGQVLFCFVWESRYTANSPDPPVRVWERIQNVGLFVFCFVVSSPNS